MSLWHLGKEIVAIGHEGTMTETVYHMGHIVWQGIRSCFGSGHWVNEKPWLDTDGWKNE